MRISFPRQKEAQCWYLHNSHIFSCRESHDCEQVFLVPWQEIMTLSAYLEEKKCSLWGFCLGWHFRPIFCCYPDNFWLSDIDHLEIMASSAVLNCVRKAGLLTPIGLEIHVIFIFWTASPQWPHLAVKGAQILPQKTLLKKFLFAQVRGIWDCYEFCTESYTLRTFRERRIFKLFEQNEISFPSPFFKAKIIQVI